MLVEEIRENLQSENKVTRLGAISFINLRLMRDPSRIDTLLSYLEDHIDAEFDHEVLSYLHSVIADWKLLRVPVDNHVFPSKKDPDRQKELMESQGPSLFTERRIVALLSYAHRDDQFHRGFITTVGESIRDAVNLYLGTDGFFDVVYDAKDIKIGEQWKRKLDMIIDQTNFLIPILSPNYILSKYCLYELERFMARERDQRRDDLIIPIKFVTLDNVDTSSSSIIENLLRRQYVDWTDLRLEQSASDKVFIAVNQLAQQVVDAISRVRTDAKQIEFSSAWPADGVTPGSSTPAY
jgi:hypothetical protein